MICVKPLQHQGRCKDATGRSWENNHPETQREADALVLADLAVRERDAMRVATETVQRSSDLLAALCTVTRLATEVEDLDDDERTALALVAPLLGVKQ